MKRIQNDALTDEQVDYSAWTNGQKVIFRIVFIFFILLTIPLDWKFYKALLNIDWSSFHFQDLFQLTAYFPQFIAADRVSAWGVASYINLGIALVIALLAGFVWTFSDRKKKGYNQYYYWLRVIVRYRLCLGVIAYGFIKLFPLQMPYPALSDLHTEYGNFLKWKIYYLSTGVSSAHYEQSLGLLEITGGLLLLFKKTATVGAGLLAALLFNVVLANFAYGIGNHVYSVYLLVLALFLLAYDIPRLYSLLVLEKPAFAAQFIPAFSKSLRYVRVFVRPVMILFIMIYGLSVYSSYHLSSWPYSDIKGLNGKSGYYNVVSFRINNQILPYSTTDSLRWQDVVLEKWNTISIKINRPVRLDATAPSISYQVNIDRNYEQAGNGGRHYYSYSADTVNKTLLLTNKNDKSDSLSFTYNYPDESTIALGGVNEKGDSLQVVLRRIDKKYLLKEGNRKPIKLF